MALFGLIGLLALVAIQGKYEKRQARLEQRYQDRLLTQRARAKMALSPPGSTPPVERGYESESEEPAAVSMAEARARTSLLPLVLVAAGVMLTGIAGLAWSRRAARLARPDETSLPPTGGNAEHGL